MPWKLLTRTDYLTTRWSGGTTTQLAISPEGADYGQRDFLWRLSSAQVELDRSQFTPLPDYLRLITPLEGKLELRVGEEPPVRLSPLEVLSFDGGSEVESLGRCTDFNLMVRKGCCRGMVQPLELFPGSSCLWNPPVSAPPDDSDRTLALFCAAGELALPQAGLRAAPGELLLCRKAEKKPVRLYASGWTKLLAVVIDSRRPQ